MRQQSQSHKNQVINISRSEDFHINSNFQDDSSPTGPKEAIEAETLQDKLVQLKAKLETISKAVNDEIQVFIAQVSLQDSDIMKRQAGRTTVLTILAVVYLPLQLITGIFGMNLKEITGEASPRWWAAFAGLVLCVSLTLLAYLGVKWWRRRREIKQLKRDFEKEKEG